MRNNCGLTIKLVGAKESMLVMGVFRTSISRILQTVIIILSNI